MGAIQASLKFHNGTVLELDGCEHVHEDGGRPVRRQGPNGPHIEHPGGVLTLRFAPGSRGLDGLSRLVAADEGASLTGTMTIVDSGGVATDYKCGYQRHRGNEFSFFFGCIQ